MYEERVSSRWTQVLFWGLMGFFVALFAWRVRSVRLDALAITFLLLCAFFLFYSLNYRTLVIRLTPDALRLRFGVFVYSVPPDNIEACDLDEIPVFLRYGGCRNTLHARPEAIPGVLQLPRPSESGPGPQETAAGA